MSFLRSKKFLPMHRMSQELSQHAALSAQLPEHDSFFHYDSGRWLYNEKEQLAARYMRFKVDALQQIAVNAVGAKRCLSMVKSNEGNFNRIFSLQCDNGSELIAKIPYPLVTPRHLSTASEVATMDYARTVLQLPVPKVLSWSARADGTDVGAEYILMEKVEGVELHQRYKNLRSEGFELIRQVGAMERGFVSRRFSQIGSLYYKDDVEPALQERPLYAEGQEDDNSAARFRIGPYVDWDIWRGTRADVEANRGPWPDVLSFMRATIDIEQKWLRKFARARSVEDVVSGSVLDTLPDFHIRLLDQLLAVIPYILPPEQISFPVLWHTDLHAGNIMVKPEGTPDMVGVIDWQGMGVAPLFMQSVFAKFARYTGDERIFIPPGVNKPILPPDFDQYPEDEQVYLRGQLRLAILHKCYEYAIIYHSPLQVAVHGYPHMEHLMPSLYSASRTWYEGAHHLNQYLIEMQENWNEIAPATPFPVRLHKQDIEQHHREYARLKMYDARVSSLAKELKLEGDGWVSNERYEKVRGRCDELQRNWDVDSNGGPFPFQDGAPSWFLS